MRVTQFSLRTLLVATVMVALAISTRSYWMLPAGMLFQKALRPVESRPIEWQPFSPERLAEARRGGKPVLFYVGADWDLSSKATLHYAVESLAVRRIIADYRVVCIKGDVTEPNTPAQAEARRYSPSISPLIVIHSPSAPNSPIVLPNFQSEESVAANLRKAVAGQRRRLPWDMLESPIAGLVGLILIVGLAQFLARKEARHALDASSSPIAS